MTLVANNPAEKLAMYLRSRASLSRRGKGIIHVGANTGQEAQRYAKHRRPVIWIEPDPNLVPILKQTVEPYPEQIVIEGLVTESDHTPATLHIASNKGGSSSILEMGDHASMFPNVTYQDRIDLVGRTLPNLLSENNVDLTDYDVLMLDTQGSELMILRGAIDILPNFKYIQIEVPDFEAYIGCATHDELVSFMDSRGFGVFIRECFKHTQGVGRYYDLTFKRRRA